MIFPKGDGTPLPGGGTTTLGGGTPFQTVPAIFNHYFTNVTVFWFRWKVTPNNWCQKISRSPTITDNPARRLSKHHRFHLRSKNYKAVGSLQQIHYMTSF